MTQFMELTTSPIDAKEAIRMKSATLDDEEEVNPILEEFLEIEIEDDDGNIISYFDLDEEEREAFHHAWVVANAYDMTPKLEDDDLDLEEYIQVQNDAFDEAMEEFASEYEGSNDLKSALATLTSNEIYARISSRVQERIRERSEAYAKSYLIANPEAGVVPKSSSSNLPGYVKPETMLKELRAHAHKGDLLINLPVSVWISAHLYYFDPLQWSQYVGIGKYPPGHVSIVKATKTNLPSKITDDGVTISAQNGSGVTNENVEDYWNCRAYLCYVSKRKWKGWRKGWRRTYPNVDKVVEYAESQMDEPYCKGGDFATAKYQKDCFICTTITWRSFNNEGYNIHRVLVRWMPTIAPADIYISSYVKRRRTIK